MKDSPAGTQRWNNVDSTLIQRLDVISMLIDVVSKFCACWELSPHSESYFETERSARTVKIKINPGLSGPGYTLHLQTR